MKTSEMQRRFLHLSYAIVKEDGECGKFTPGVLLAMKRSFKLDDFESQLLNFNLLKNSKQNWIEFSEEIAIF